jgi:phosphoglycolate phosphatase
MNKKLIIWDWNGTLLSDVDACVESMNKMLNVREMGRLTHDRYKSIFTFPVQSYYERLGFDFKTDSFEELSIEYIDLYNKQAINSPLQEGALESLNYFRSLNFAQVIISAAEQTLLEKQVEQRGITEYFDSLIGLDNIHAKSKLQNALNYINDSQFDVKNAILIGDTYHDYEVADAMGCKCILVKNGHQYLNQKEINGSLKIIDSLDLLPELFKNYSIT